MKKLALLLIVLGSLVSGCVAYDTPYRDRGMNRGDREGGHDRMERDHDRDGGMDRRLSDPRRY